MDPALIEKYGNVIPVHPTQLYEVGLSLLIFALLWRLQLRGTPPVATRRLGAGESWAPDASAGAKRSRTAAPLSAACRT